MVKRKAPVQASTKTGKRNCKTATKSAKSTKPTQPSRLLALPPELRNRIYKNVVTTDLIFLYTKSYTEGAPQSVESFGSISLNPYDIRGTCTTNHQERQPGKDGKPGKLILQTKGTGALSWLRTNRQVYKEAKAIVYANLKFHICHPLEFSGLVTPPRKSLTRYPNNRSFSFCVNATVEHDSNGFRLGTGQRQHGWENSLHGPGGCCCCPFCFALNSLPRVLESQLMNIAQLDLRVFFSCKWMFNVIGTAEDWARMPNPLTCLDDDKSVDTFVNAFCEQKPLGLFLERNIGRVKVTLACERIEHSVPDKEPCWCRGKSIDEDSLRRLDIVNKIKTRLMRGNDHGSSTAR
ncbi:hypothetical protein ONS95_007261 [Cadophora gregata]|uniref:uncharacterized protein n=1 Tax=Cadophora gregata TaxID=51156 RepID=UPI0026DA8E67|nr:uncharacterized protein ONS95_007261 [Cadophora gregata]KAK0100813.1 hypothetical protein ONS95_007261 [Cadophora gregata]KAK0117193.1 hypothetical protein ONS96_013026 [Cadophora gregata f. sp. sojae]